MLANFLQDVVQFVPLVRTMFGMALRDPPAVLRSMAQVLLLFSCTACLHTNWFVHANWQSS